MSSLWVLRLAVASITVAAGLAFSTPASASVIYDPETKTGFVDGSDVRDAFGWTAVRLAVRARDVAFDQDFWTDNTYSASCGEDTFEIVHHREYGRLALTSALVQRDRGAPAAYHDRLIGFRLSGAFAGISGTSAPPAAGQPCPQGQPSSATIDEVQLVSSTTGWALVVKYHDIRRELLTQQGSTPAN